ncbi:MAG: hypothetical protein HOO67_05355 [Candidatus Peribacteraceae bacterium]|nr:hypothetical protein [Candidatus Peribacteraceae bacterium]
MNTLRPSDFLAELYALDPNLQAHEAQLLPIITQLLESDPAKSPDPAFVASLRGRLRLRADEISAGSHVEDVRWFSNIRTFFTIAIPTAAIAVLIPVVFIFQNRSGLPVSPSPSSTIVMEDAGKNAFGPLTDLNPGSLSTGRAQGGGGGVIMGGDSAAPVPPAVPVRMAEGAATNAVTSEATMDYGTSDMKMIAPYPMVQYEYVFEGPITGLTPTILVYKRTPNASSLPLSSIASSLNFGTLKLNSFSGMSVDSLTFTQNQSFGYQLFVNLRDSSMSLDAQWDQWPQSKCTTEACYRSEQITLAQLPSDAQLIGIANDFVSDHGIDLSAYGAPEVDQTWKLDYDRAPDKNSAYVPEVQRVIYPLMIDSKPVHDQSGAKAGLILGVHAKHKRVMNVWGIMDRSYAKSDYDGVTDEAAIKKYLSQMDNYGMPEDMKAKKVRILLGEPVIASSVYFRYTDAKSDELLVPSLIFPVKSAEGAEPSGYYRSTIVVPLAKDLLSSPWGGGVMPMMEGAVR